MPRGAGCPDPIGGLGQQVEVMDETLVVSVGDGVTHHDNKIRA